MKINKYMVRRFILKTIITVLLLIFIINISEVPTEYQTYNEFLECEQLADNESNYELYLSMKGGEK